MGKTKNVDIIYTSKIIIIKSKTLSYLFNFLSTWISSWESRIGKYIGLECLGVGVVYIRQHVVCHGHCSFPQRSS